MDNREVWLTETLLDLSRATSTADIDTLLGLMTDRLDDLIPDVETALVRTPPTGELDVTATSTDRLRALTFFELHMDDGPLMECRHTGQRILNATIEASSTARARWPMFGPVAFASGYRTTHALPMRHTGDLLAVVSLFTPAPSHLSQADTAMVESIVAAATLGLVNRRRRDEVRDRTDQLQIALVSRPVLEQAKGIIASRLGMSPEDAFNVLRAVARRGNRRVIELAHAVVDRTVTPDELVRLPANHASR